MASKYILSRDQFLLNEAISENPLYDFFSEVGVDLIKIIERVSPVLPDSVTDEFIEKSQLYQEELQKIGFTEVSKLEHTLYAMGVTGITLFEQSGFKIQSVVDQYYKINEDFFDTLRSIWNALTENGSPLGILHLVLDIIGFIPFTYVGVPIDVAADVINAIIYLFEGQYGSALISAIAAALPGIGDVGKGLKVAKGFKNINKIAEVAFKTGKADKKLVQILAKEDPGTFAKFIQLFTTAKPVVTFFAKVLTGIGRGIEALLRTWPISMLFGGLGKKLGKWLDTAAAPITKNLDSAIDDMATLGTKGSDDITAAIKSGDASKVADAGTKLVDDLVDAQTAAKAAGNMEEVTRIEKILQTRLKDIQANPKNGGWFVKNGRLLDVVNANVKATDDMLKAGKGAELDAFLRKGWKENIDTWKEISKINGIPLGPNELRQLDQLEDLWVAGRKAEALFAGVKKLDDLPIGDLIKLSGDAASITTKRGANFSARLITELSADPAKLSKFFNGILADPRTLAKLEEAGPGVVGMYRLFAKNPEVYSDIAKSGSAAIKHFEKIAAEGGKWGQAIRTSRFQRNRLIIAKHIIGAPLRCPIAELGQGSIGGLDALAGSFGGTLKRESYKFILGRNQFLFEEAPANSSEPTPGEKIDQAMADVKQRSANPAVLGPISYVDICQSHIAKVIDEAAATATFPSKDSGMVKNGPQETYAAAGVHSESAIDNKEALERVLEHQFGIAAPISSAGMMVELPANATIFEVVQERIGEDYKYGGMWYMLGGIMTGVILYNDVKKDLEASMRQYERNYERTQGNTLTTGAISFYPSPGEANLIKEELKKLEADPNYSPRFFGPSITPGELSKMF